MTNKTIVQPKYEAIVNDVDQVNKYDDDDDDDDGHQTAVVMAMADDGYYYPIKYDSTSSSVGTSSMMKKRRKGTGGSCCRICGCITGSIFGCILLLIVIVGVVWYSLIVRGVRMITVETPIDFPIVTVSDDELNQVSDQIHVFLNAIVNDSTMIDDLILPSRIINGAISKSDYLRGHAQILMKQDELIVQTSLPMDMIPGGTHRFFVSTLDSATAMTDTTDGTTAAVGSTLTTTSFDLGKKFSDDYDGPLLVGEFLSYFMTTKMEWVVNILSMNVLGEEQMTPELIAQNVNILQQIYDDPNNQRDPNRQNFLKIMNGIASIHIEPDQMILRARTNFPETITAVTTTSTLNTKDLTIVDDDMEGDTEEDEEPKETTSVTANEKQDHGPSFFFLRH